jgi:hypothetical protein
MTQLWAVSGSSRFSVQSNQAEAFTAGCPAPAQARSTDFRIRASAFRAWGSPASAAR